MKHVILLPTYNEAENIEKVVTLVMTSYPDVYIKVIDDNSPDGTATIVSRLMQKFPHLSLLLRKGKQGLGKAYMHGFQEAMKDQETTHVIMMDADLSHDPKYLAEMIRQSADFDVVIGSRYIPEGGTVDWEWWRKVLSWAANTYARIITRVPIHDVTAGFNCISIRALSSIDLNLINLYPFLIGNILCTYLIHYLSYSALAGLRKIMPHLKSLCLGSTGNLKLQFI